MTAVLKSRSGNTTTVGYTNPRGQRVVSATELKGTDHNSRVYELQCGSCGLRYGANGADIHIRKCPKCQDGRPGLSLETPSCIDVATNRWSVADAKAKFSEVIDTAQTGGAQIVTKNGRDVAVVVSFEEWTRRTARRGTLLEMFQSAPEGFADLDFSRARDTARDIEL